MSNYDIFLLRGDGNGDPGACANGYTEENLAQVIVDRVVELLKGKGVKVFTNTKNQNNYVNNCLGPHTFNYKFCYTIHLNSASSTATGTEIFVPINEQYVNTETKMCKEIANTLGINTRGVKSRDYNSGATHLRIEKDGSKGTDYYKEIRESWQNGLSHSIIELCFISNLNDVKQLLNNKEKVCRIIANNILAYLDKPTYNMEVQDNKVDKTDGSMYYVQVGAFKNKDNAIALQKKLIADGYKAIIK
jgi:N-acetylmuramoyl-L-alanine amidase